MSFSTSGPKGLTSEINVTPLIDVLLVLLIIFMVIVPLAPLGLSTTIPTAGDTASPSLHAESAVLLQVDGDATHVLYRMDGVAVASDTLGIRLHGLMSTRANRQLLLQADPRLDFGTVSHVVDAARAAGADSIGLITPKLAR